MNGIFFFFLVAEEKALFLATDFWDSINVPLSFEYNMVYRSFSRSTLLKARGISCMLFESYICKAAYEEFCWMQIDLNFPEEKKKLSRTSHIWNRRIVKTEYLFIPVSSLSISFISSARIVSNLGNSVFVFSFLLCSSDNWKCPPPFFFGGDVKPESQPYHVKGGRGRTERKSLRMLF